MKIFQAVWLILTLNCEQSARLFSEGFDRKLSWSERIAVRCHHAVCRSSRELSKQMAAFERSIRQNPNLLQNADEALVEQTVLSAAARARIKEELAKAASLSEDGE